MKQLLVTIKQNTPIDSQISSEQITHVDETRLERALIEVANIGIGSALGLAFRLLQENPNWGKNPIVLAESVAAMLEKHHASLPTTKFPKQDAEADRDN